MLQKALGRATLAREISHGLQLGAELLIQAREQVMLVAQGLLRLRAAHADAFLEVLETLLSHVSVRSLESREKTVRTTLESKSSSAWTEQIASALEARTRSHLRRISSAGTGA